MGVTVQKSCLDQGTRASGMKMVDGQRFFFSSGLAYSRKNWGFGFALERILACWQAAAVSGVRGVHARGERCSS
jgi:hypothetical protein